MNNNYSFPIRIYYEDTDAGGIVYYANYLKFMERSRTEWLRSLAIEQDQLRDELGIIFVVRSVTINYLKPAIFNDLLDVSVHLDLIGKTHLTISQEITNTHSEVLCNAEISLVCIDKQRFRPRKIPPFILQKIKPSTFKKE